MHVHIDSMWFMKFLHFHEMQGLFQSGADRGLGWLWSRVSEGDVQHQWPGTQRASENGRMGIDAKILS